jgi:cytochrome c oxidase subunit 3
MNMAGGTPKHPYHLVDPSPWPALGSLAALILALGFGFALHPDMLGQGFGNFMKSVHWWGIAPGLLLVLGVMYWWWSDVIAESRVYHTSVVQLGLRYGMILFIASEVLFFAAFFWAFFDAALYPGAPNQPIRAEATGGIWPPKGISIIAPFDLPLMNTLILLLSGTTATWAHHAIIEGIRRTPSAACCAPCSSAWSSPASRPTSTSTHRSRSARTSTRRPSSWRRASTASTCWSARSS